MKVTIVHTNNKKTASRKYQDDGEADGTIRKR